MGLIDMNTETQMSIIAKQLRGNRYGITCLH